VRRFPLPLLALVLLLVAAGCGAATGPAPEVSRPAKAQTAELGWVESAGSGQSKLVFRVRSFAVTEHGWSSSLSVTNDTDATFTIAGIAPPFTHAFGVMVFATGSHDELEQRNAQVTLPSLREATHFAPALPGTLRPHATWSGTVFATGALPSGGWVRVVFGAFDPTKEMPESLVASWAAKDLIWITDHAHRLS